MYGSSIVPEPKITVPNEVVAPGAKYITVPASEVVVVLVVVVVVVVLAEVVVVVEAIVVVVVMEEDELEAEELLELDELLELTEEVVVEVVVETLGSVSIPFPQP